MNALLRHDEGFWYDHFAVHERLGSGTPEVKFALRDLGQFAGPIDGTASPQLDAAVDAFKTANGLGGTGLTAATRQAIGEALLQKIGATFAPLRNEAAWGVREIQSMLTLLGQYTGPINGVNTAATQTAVRAFQASEGLTQDGSVGLVTRIALIRRYQGALFSTALAADRFHAGAVFGCGEAFPIVPTPDNVESAQNRRVEVIFRRTPVTPIDPNQVGAAVPFLQWTAPEFDGAPPAEPPKVVVAITDTGFGRSSPGDNFSGEQGKLPNDLLIKGERLLRPTDTSGANAGNPTLQTVSVDGNLQNVGDVTALGGGAPPGGGHGSAVMTCLGADGVGSPVGGLPRTARNTVLGTAPHVHIRPIRISAAGGGANFFSYMLGLEAIANDPEVLVHTTSIADWVASASFTPAQLRALQERAQEMVMQGKLMFSVPQNYNGGAFPTRYWAGTTQWGRLGPDKRNARSTNSGANEFRRRLEIVGATARVGRAPAGGALTVNVPGQQEIIADFSFVGEQVGIFMPGSQIRAVMPSAAALVGALGSPVPIAAQNVTVGGIDGTSFATPMTAGVAAELMLLDPDLRQAANVARVLEYLEATADPLPNVNPAGGTGAPANQRVNDPTIAGNAAHPSFSGIRRVHFWKAALAALNKGLSAETRGAAGAQDPFFTFCTLRDDASTEFYGFEIRSPVPDATVWLRKASGEIVPAQDAGAVFPAGRTSASCWRTVDALQLGPNQPLPAFPWPAATFPAGRRVFFLCQFSIAKALLAQFQSLVLHLPAADPRQPGGADSPPLLDLRVDDRPTMRNPGAIPPGAPAPQLALKTFVQAFDDFVFHLAGVPQPLASFLCFAQGHRTALGVGETVTVFVFAVDGFGNLTDPGALAVNLTHNGTPGSAAPVTGVFLGGAPAAAAGVPLAFGAGGDPRGMARVQFQGNTAENVTLSVNDGAGHAGSVTMQVAAAGAVSGLQLEVRRRGGGASVVAQPAFAGEPVELAVRAVDAGGRVRADFTGDVRLRVLQGETGSDGPPPARGVHVKLNDADPFSANAFHHVFTAADAGQFVFPLFCYTTGTLQLEASGGGASGQSESIEITAGPVASFAVQSSSPQKAGKRFELVLTAMDAHQNRAERFAGQVAISLAAGTAGVAGPPPDGVFIGDTALVADDTVSFAQADAGVLRVPVTCFRTENVQFRATHNPPGGGAAIVSTSSPIQIQAAGALHHFRFEVTGAGRAGAAFQLRVIAEDAGGSRLTGFAGNVQIAIVAGTAFNAAPRQGVLIETAPGVAGNAHVFAPADAGAFTFRITPFTAEAVTLSASDGAAVTTNTPALNIGAGLFAQLAVLPAGGARRNVPFAVRVEARDAFNNVVLDFLGQVNLLVNPGTGAFAPVAGPAGQHPFAVADAGVHVFNLTVATSGAGHQVRATDGNVAGTSAAFNVAP
jgi:peptidoglycan hydrolase-like protein with peptidoglycan-binding domain